MWVSSVGCCPSKMPPTFPDDAVDRQKLENQIIIIADPASLDLHV